MASQRLIADLDLVGPQIVRPVHRMIITFICIFSLAQNVQMSSAEKNSCASFNTVHEYLTKAEPSNDVDLNAQAMKVFVEEGLHRRSKELRRLASAMATLQSPKVAIDCGVAGRGIIRLRNLVRDLVGERGFKYCSAGMRVAQVYQDAVAKFEKLCQQQLADKCQLINSKYTSTKISRLISILSTQELIETGFFLSIKKHFSSSGHKDQSRRSDIRWLECALENRRKFVDASQDKDATLIESYINRIVERIPGYQDAKDDKWRLKRLRVAYIDSACSQLLRKASPALVIKEAVDLVAAAEDRVKLVSVLPEKDACFEAIYFYVSCEIIKIFSKPLEIPI